MRRGTFAIIPVRLASTRFPRKALADIHGKPTVQRVYEGCMGTKGIDEIYVATPDEEVANIVRDFGGQYVMTGKHNTVLGRCAEASRILRPDIVVVVQGDEPMVNSHMLELALSGLNCKYSYSKSKESFGVSTLVKELEPDEDPADRNMVKVVVNHQGYVMYASRAIIPGHTPEKYGTFQPPLYKQSCIMAFGWRSLEAYDTLAQLVMEKSEGIDIVRFLYYGQPVKAVVSPYNTQALDVEADLERIRELWPIISSRAAQAS